LGSSRTIKVDVRIIAATNRELEKEAQKGRFRKDLWYRLNVFPITIPPLKDRQEDIPMLAKWFVRIYSQQMGKKIDSIPVRMSDMLVNYLWPGNVRELQNVISRAVVCSKNSTLKLADKLESLQYTEMGELADKSLEQIEHDYITRVLEKTHWKIEGVGGAASILELNPSTLRSRMRKLDIKEG
jgi:transcriptional regulator with GAF, ATPase, and Fis domain